VRYDVVHERDKERLTAPARREVGPLEAPYGIVAVHGTLPLRIYPGQDVERVVREEALHVQGVPEHLCHGGGGHGLAMVVVVHLHLDVEDAPELIDVCLAPRAAQNAFVGEGMELRYRPAEYGISRRQTCVGGHDGVVGTGDGEGGTAVELVRAESPLVRRLGDAVVDARAVDEAAGHLLLPIVLPSRAAHGEILTVESDRYDGPTLGGLDGEAGLAVAGVDRGRGGKESHVIIAWVLVSILLLVAELLERDGSVKK